MIIRKWLKLQNWYFGLSYFSSGLLKIFQFWLKSLLNNFFLERDTPENSFPHKTTVKYLCISKTLCQ